MNIRRSVSGVVVGDPWVAVWRSIWTSHQWIVSPVSPVSPVQGVPPHPIPVSPFTPKSRLFWPSRFLCLFVCFLSFPFVSFSTPLAFLFPLDSIRLSIYVSRGGGVGFHTLFSPVLFSIPSFLISVTLTSGLSVGSCFLFWIAVVDRRSSLLRS